MLFQAFFLCFASKESSPGSRDKSAGFQSAAVMKGPGPRESWHLYAESVLCSLFNGAVRRAGRPFPGRSSAGTAHSENGAFPTNRLLLFLCQDFKLNLEIRSDGCPARQPDGDCLLKIRHSFIVCASCGVNECVSERVYKTGPAFRLWHGCFWIIIK